ncbi:MAG: linked oxidase domain protein, partial [Hyphomicrobiales bacterium]|nr:linked oxidase domain protein [Hyphomicrobiales bacterium]
MLDEPETTLPARLAAIVGAKHVIADAGEMTAWLTEPRDLFHGRAACVVRPGSTDEVAAVLRLCHETGTPVVPQGGNTGLVGGQSPDASGAQVILSLTRMDKMRELDVPSNTMIVEAGMTLLRAQDIAEQADRLFPLSLASEGSCTVGGNLSTNAGGTAVLAYGNARDLVQGLEVVLADGRVLNNLSKLKKDNTGYDLKHLFMGSEGTLGIITAAVLKLYPRPRSTETAFIGLQNPQRALDLFLLAQAQAGNDVKTFELVPRIGIDFALMHGANTREPLASRHDWYVLIEIASQAEISARMLGLLEEAFAQGLIENATLAASLEQARDFWRLRELMSDVQKLEGGSIKHDVSVPVARVPEFIAAAGAAIARAMPGARLVPFGHLGDGNIHYNISQPVGADKQAFLARWHEANDIVH